MCRRTFGLSDRTLGVLNALLTFHPRNELDPAESLVVFPSNATLSARVHGMPESTLRRHLGHLVRAGFLIRRDSPNGKRYARRARDGDQGRAFGFDLTPLLQRAGEIAEAAEMVEAEAEELRRQREDLAVDLREASDLSADESESVFTEIRKALRRVLSKEAVAEMRARLAVVLDALRSRLAAAKRSEVSGNDTQNERHHQRSKPYYPDESTAPPNEPTLEHVREVCPDIESFCPGGTKDWSSLFASVEMLGRMIGIGPKLWSQAVDAMGPRAAAATLAALVQRTSEIRNPSAYLTVLVRKARHGAFSSKVMLGSLSAAQS
ncbi:plasmid replication protein RepC [Palleronia sp. LCG004]|uniref:plasmid replication protein RepC n=1 Tax=Palleronia sp. LCG004 TaxID=3079304 RepID=UPI002943AF24|nr:plasmid replication protein RepC [Palleronia sp. LCG004]WOI58219.1 plasmid replication protein RepC [Palleronia sp. LCG004]